MPVAAVALDLGGVLVQVDHRRFCAGLAATAPGLTPAAVHRAIFLSDLEPRYDTGHLSSREFYREISGRLGVSLPYQRFCTLWNDIFAPMDGMEEVVASLAGRFPLFLLSNTNPLHFHYIRERYPVVRRVARTVLSYRVGSRKPEPAIYQALIARTGEPPGNILFVDDKLPFVEAARQVGLIAWQFSDPGDLRRWLTQFGLL